VRRDYLAEICFNLIHLAFHGNSLDGCGNGGKAEDFAFDTPFMLCGRRQPSF
jgi:hypothetical protein